MTYCFPITNSDERSMLVLFRRMSLKSSNKFDLKIKKRNTFVCLNEMQSRRVKEDVYN